MIGTAGTRYFKDTTNPNIYTSPIGRPDKGNVKYTDEQDLMIYFDKARRIEMRPSSDPEMQQLVVGSNGGDPKDQIQLGNTYDPYTTEIGRDNELIRNDSTNPPSVVNLTTPDTTPGRVGKATFYQPCVAIPVEG